MDADRLAGELMSRFGLGGFRILRNKNGYRFKEIRDGAKVVTAPTFEEMAEKVLVNPA